MPTKLFSLFEQIGKLFGHKEHTVNQKVSPTIVKTGDINISITIVKD